ncbi:MAG: hydroxymethylglutaryl-CoA reductase, degradative [archaeon]
MGSSEISGFYKKSLEERLSIVREFAKLDEAEIELLKKFGAMDFETANRMVENVVSTQQLPLGIATNFRVNGKDCLVPMALEEPSVVAAASKAAGIAREKGGFSAEATPPIMVGQVQLVHLKEAKRAVKEIERNAGRLVDLANQADPVLVKFGGGAKKIESRAIETKRGKMVIVHLLVDVKDAMGANAVNTMCETIAPELEKLSGGEARLRIISNLAVYRTVKAKATFSKKALEESFKEGALKGEEIIEHILDAYHFAANDAFRACTHNKGIMNGIDAVAIATGQDFRALEAGAHAFASLKGKYTALTSYSKDREGNLVGEIEMPIAVGLVGGAVKTSPVAKIAVKILGIKTASELAEIMAAVGLAQNFAALRALATEGIQKGHMRLHAKNIAVMAGAKGKEIDEIAEKMASERNVRVDRAKELLKEFGEK